jgi:hypothetical protein
MSCNHLQLPGLQLQLQQSRDLAGSLHQLAGLAPACTATTRYFTPVGSGAAHEQQLRLVLSAQGCLSSWPASGPVARVALALRCGCGWCCLLRPQSMAC